MVTSTTDALSAATSRPPHPLHDYVRKVESSEILVQDWRQDSAESQIVTLRWPRAHAFYTLREDVTSPLLFTESVRQALALLSNTVHHIPLDHRLGWEYARFSVAPDAFRGDARPALVDLRVTHTAVSRRRLGSVQVTAMIEATGDGAYAGSAEIRYITHPPAFYNRLRGRYADAGESFAKAAPPPPPVDAALVGRGCPRDVVLASTGTPHRWQLRTDTTHEVLFDHSHDHVPGMVLLEAAAQAAQAEAGPRPVLAVGYETTFSRYVELDQACWITAEPAAPDLLGRSRLKVDAVQGDHLVSSTLVSVEPLDAAPADPVH
ncbi:ScbA/BarX family gamma-butyrolactone biosynthesis protein [Streptomyces sp. TS71-3]|uniref:ScbA/BarX family gamma-butyrolactone biosynthesis protein n=1 Tax=Streptomyces sp. TS71-3 TaxID=2733862 RepID=UPI001B1173CB|nr:ScbA/BarX family gamma-butyrolactone biosynthesis protein [Streptomyces sp. TS71-3]GHJ42323.1 adhesin [Streptomyces sp. TS71-3]